MNATAFETAAEKMNLPDLPEFPLPPFVKHIAPDRRDTAAFDFWAVEHTGDAAADFKLGVLYYHLALALERVLGRTDITALVTTALVLKGKLDSIEAGFLFVPLEHARTVIVH
jgi:hypothetical protein